MMNLFLRMFGDQTVVPASAADNIYVAVYVHAQKPGSETAGP
jgi:hypothetical protein